MSGATIRDTRPSDEEVAMTLGYDDIADWYEREFAPSREPGHRGGLDEVLADLLGSGEGVCLDVGCGTGSYAAPTSALGWTALGVDLSAGMLSHARTRLPISRADATRLPIADASVPAAISVMVHTDMPAYPDVLREVERVLRPGGVFVHIGVHPCFCGGFADWSDRQAVVIRPGYLDHYWTTDSYTTAGLRVRVGATHRPLPDLLHSFSATGLSIERFAEHGEPTPFVLACRARKPGHGREVVVDHAAGSGQTAEHDAGE
jgi:ubiquinone/menaquinone biosynthesis C-methylase UbiE